MTANKNVLIIDDEPEICMLLASIIKKYNMNPVYVHSVSAALAEVEKIQPALTFLDISLPDGNGLDLLSKFRLSYPFMKVVIISAFDRYRNTAMSIGAYGFLSKPFTKSSVTDVLTSKV
ncbi:MAG: response regulator [Chitinophagales bacterium]